MSSDDLMVSVDVHIVLRQVNIGAAHLWNPSDSSWIASIAAIFYALAIAVASPVILLVALDFTSYAIVRTLGIDNAHPTSSKRLESSTPVLEADPAASASVIKGKGRKPSAIAIPPPSLDAGTPPQIYFTTPGAANLKLAGVGLFSPPHSRTPSPPITRRSSAKQFASQVSLGSIIDGPKGATPHPEAQEPALHAQPQNGSDDDAETPLPVLLRRRKPTALTSGS